METSAPFRLSVIVPVFNERFTLAKVVQRVLEQEGQPGIASIQVIVVDDGSTDGSRDILRALAARHPQILALFHDRNQGKTGAIRTGIARADGEVIVFQDADLEYDPKEFSRLICPILEGHADVVFGSRFMVAEYRRVLYFWHALLNWGLTNLSNMLTDLDLTDMETCYKMFRAPLLKTIPLRSTGFGLEPELTAKAAKRNLRVYEVPISYKGRTYDEGKKITWKDGCWALYYILKYWLIDDCNTEVGNDFLHQVSLAPRFNCWTADVIRPFLGGKVLEIGAEIGNLTSRFLPRDEYTACVADDKNLETLRSRFGHEGRATIRKLDPNDPDQFRGLESTQETVLCLNVLEHIEDDDGLLIRIYTTLQPDGTLVLLVPQGPRLFGSLDRAVGHCRRYARRDLERKLVAAGFSIDRIIDFNTPGVLGWWLMGKVLGSTRLGKLPMKIFDHLVWLFRRIDHLLPWSGLSLIAVARKGKTGQG